MANLLERVGLHRVPTHDFLRDLKAMAQRKQVGFLLASRVFRTAKRGFWTKDTEKSIFSTYLSGEVDSFANSAF